MTTRRDAWYLVDLALRHSPRILLHGPPGVGKTYAAMHAEGNHKGVYSITLTEDTPAAELRGHFIPSGGSFVWHDGPAIRAWREGARLVLNEIGEAGADCLVFLYAICDDADFAALTLPTGETVRPVEGFQVIATTNELPTVLTPALQDRFIPSIHITEPHPDALALFGRTAQTVKVTIGNGVTMRQWLAFRSLTGQQIDPAAAAILAFGEPMAGSVLAAIRIADVRSGDAWTQ